MTDRYADMMLILSHVRAARTNQPLFEDEASDDEIREQAMAAAQQVRDFLDRHESYLSDVLQPARDGDFALRGSMAGLDRNLIIVFTHEGHSGIGTAGGKDVILIRSLLSAGSTKYLNTRFSGDTWDSFVHEYAHYLSRGRGYVNSVKDYEERGEAAYYSNHDEVNSYYIEASAGFKRLMKNLIQYATPDLLRPYQEMTDHELYAFMLRSCGDKGFLKNADAQARRRFDKRAMRFIAQTVRPLLASAVAQNGA